MQVGIDYGTRKVAMAALPPKGGGAAPVVFSHFCTPARCPTTRGGLFHKAQHLSDQVALWLLDLNADTAKGFAVVEMPYLGLSKSVSMQMAVVAGCLSTMAVVAAPGLEVFLEQPSRWRSRIIPGRTGKKEVMEWLAAEHPEAKWTNDDEADALGMAYSAGKQMN